MIIQLAWRNLWRQPRRTILSSLTIAFTTTLLIFMPSMQSGSYNIMIENTLRMYDGYAEILQAGYRDNPEIRKTINKPEQLIDEIKQQTGLSSISVRADGSAILSSESRSLGARVVGVLPDSESMVSTIPDNITAGRFLKGNNSNEIVMGSTLAKNLQLELGDRVTLLGMAKDGSLAADSLILTGTFTTGLNALDRLQAEMPLGRFQETFAMQDQAHTIILNSETLSTFQGTFDSVASIAEKHELVLLDWKALQPGLWQGILLDISSAALIYLTLIVVVAFSLLNSILMSILERTREFGVLLALGMSPGNISRMVLVETLLILCIGLGLGFIFGYLLTDYYAYVGIHFEEAQEIFSRYGLGGGIYPDLNIITLLAGPSIIAISVLLAGLFPILRIHRMQAVAAMRSI